MAGYQWRDNAACRATYKVYTHPVLNQIRPETVSFEDAGAQTMGTLPFFNHTASGSLRQKIARLRAQEFLLYLKDIHPLAREDDNVTLDEFYQELAAVLSSKTATVADFAGALDKNIKFPDEA
ncbi:MAG: hypothetical protein RJA14_1731 [Pseudomonadota bacterium]